MLGKSAITPSLRGRCAFALALGVASALLLTLLNGCRIQNKSEFSQIMPADDVSGFYETTIAAVQYCTKINSSTDINCRTYTPTDTPSITSKIPPLFSGVFSNPVALILQDRTDGSSGLFSARGGSGIPTTASGGSGGGNIRYTGLFQPSSVWRDPQCLSQLLFEQEGTYTRYPNRNAKKINDLPIYGAINFIGQVTETYYGRDLNTDCGPTLSQLYACYQDPNQCGGTSSENPQFYAQVHSIFDPYITAGVLTPTEIQAVEQLIYAVEYVRPRTTP